MSACACGHHHPAPAAIEGGVAISLARPLIALSGSLICADMAQMTLALHLLPDHVTLSRAEPGNLRFDLAQQDDPLIWRLDELFADQAAFDAHGARNMASRWGMESTAIGRDFQKRPVTPTIRRAHPRDHAQIAALLMRAFDGGAHQQRGQGDVALSLVAEAAGTIIGHAALTPVQAGLPALALAPVCVHPAVQRRGIGAALIAAAIDAFADHAIIVSGDAAYFHRFGFEAAAPASPFYASGVMVRPAGAPHTGSRTPDAPAFSMP